MAGMKHISNKLFDLCRQHGVRDLHVFGSRADEISAMVRNLPESYLPTDADVDIGIFPADSTHWTPEKKVELTIELEDLFQVRVDLVLLPEADPFLCADIIAGELLFTKDPDQQARYELFVLRRTGDLRRPMTALGVRRYAMVDGQLDGSFGSRAPCQTATIQTTSFLIL